MVSKLKKQKATAACRTCASFSFCAAVVRAGRRMCCPTREQKG